MRRVALGKPVHVSDDALEEVGRTSLYHRIMRVATGPLHGLTMPGAARSFGLITGFIPRLTEYRSAQTTDLKPEDNWTYVASSAEYPAPAARRLTSNAVRRSV